MTLAMGVWASFGCCVVGFARVAEKPADGGVVGVRGELLENSQDGDEDLEEKLPVDSHEAPIRAGLL